MFPGFLASPSVDVQALDTNRIPKDLLDGKLCASYKVLPLAETRQPLGDRYRRPHQSRSR